MEKKRRRDDDSLEFIHKGKDRQAYRGDDLVLEYCTSCVVRGNGAVLISCTDCTVIGADARVYNSKNCKVEGARSKFVRCSDDRPARASVAHPAPIAPKETVSVHVKKGIGVQTSDVKSATSFSSGSTASFGEHSTVMLRKASDGKTYVNEIEVPHDTTVHAGTVFYNGSPITRQSEAILRLFPCFSRVLDTIERSQRSTNAVFINYF